MPDTIFLSFPPTFSPISRDLWRSKGTKSVRIDAVCPMDSTVHVAVSMNLSGHARYEYEPKWIDRRTKVLGLDVRRGSMGYYCWGRRWLSWIYPDVVYAYAPAAACIWSGLDTYVMSFLVFNRIWMLWNCHRLLFLLVCSNHSDSQLYRLFM